MTRTPDRTALPEGMPVLARGSHRNPARGACFMEYTSLLAGEPFTDEPRCVDEELAAILRAANDKLSDRDRPRLAELLGRAIGLTVEPPEPGRPPGRGAEARRQRRAAVARYDEQTALLHRAVARRFVAALDPPPPPPSFRYGAGGELFWLFWDSLDRPRGRSPSDAHVRQLVARLDLLHDCYEQAMDELGLPRPGRPGVGVPGTVAAHPSAPGGTP
ncbi:hypothetical protein ACI78T_02825 [Blastococcus sp. SYSU D00922]